MTTFDAARHCGATTRQPGRGPCRNAKGFKTSHRGAGNCYLHGGRSPSGRRHAEREAAAAALRKLGVPIEVEPQQALLGQVWEAMGNVAFLRAKVQALTAIHGIDHLGDARPNVLVAMYNEERDRLAKICKLAIDAGIAERAIAIAEQQAEAIVAVITGVLDALGLPREKRDAAQATAVELLREFGARDVVLGSRN